MTTPIAVCPSDALVDGGLGVRFPVGTRSGRASGFVVRFDGIAHGYLNRCAHAGIELDWAKGEFFDRSGRFLLCATHGAIYAPDSGRCAGGACRGQPLTRLVVDEREGTIWWIPDQSFHAVDPPTVPP